MRQGSSRSLWLLSWMLCETWYAHESTTSTWERGLLIPLVIMSLNATRVSALCLQVKGSQQEVSNLSTALQKATSEAETSASQITEAEARVGSLQMELQVPHKS